MQSHDQFVLFKWCCGYVMVFNDTFITKSLYVWWVLLLLLQQVATWQGLLSWRPSSQTTLTNEGGGYWYCYNKSLHDKDYFHDDPPHRNNTYEGRVYFSYNKSLPDKNYFHDDLLAETTQIGGGINWYCYKKSLLDKRLLSCWPPHRNIKRM